MIGNRSCLQIKEGITDYLEDALAPGARQEFEKHLESCRECAGFLAQIRITLATAHGLPRVPAPPELKQRILREIREGKPSE